jgi:hypothetical protein
LSSRPRKNAIEFTGPLAAYIALLHVCGPEALQRSFRPDVFPDIFTIWNSVALIFVPC